MDGICKNPGRDDHWNCPRCYADMPRCNGHQEGAAICPNCAVELVLSVEHEPVCVARIPDEDEV